MSTSAASLLFCVQTVNEIQSGKIAPSRSSMDCYTIHLSRLISRVSVPIFLDLCQLVKEILCIIDNNTANLFLSANYGELHNTEHLEINYQYLIFSLGTTCIKK